MIMEKRYIFFVWTMLQGICFGFPLCCVLQFSKEMCGFKEVTRFSWEKGYSENDWFSLDDEKWKRAPWNQAPGYIPCDKCIERYRNEGKDN